MIVLDPSQDFLDFLGERSLSQLQVRDRNHFAFDRVIEIRRPGTVRIEADLFAPFHIAGF